MKIYFTLAFLISVTVLQAQNIKVYFNQSVDNSASSITDARTSSHLEDTICSLINSANITVDIAVWDNGSAAIISALNNAYNRGVQVRYISSSNSLNSALSGLNSNISLLERNSTLASNVMHNKFVIVDNALLLTGSMNFGNGSMEDDYNNIVIVSNTALAQNYTAEFNEMWGSTAAAPNLSNSKFGPAKADNTIHSFNIGGIVIQNYFSPTDNTSNQIVNAINSADYSLDIAMFTFTDNDIGDAVVAAKNRGVNVRCIMENSNYFGSEYNSLVSNGIATFSHVNIANDFHHKYCIIDAMHGSSDPIVVTGSHNWSNSAEDEYDENILIINSEIIANQYTEEFLQRFSEFGSVGINETGKINCYTIYPNPNSGDFFIESTNKNYSLDIVNLLGEQVLSEKNSTVKRFSLPKGIYFIKITSEDKRESLQKVIVN
ncbi:MAG: phospholipase D-like domain-containing protein [Bacteroidota bacterium]